MININYTMHKEIKILLTLRTSIVDWKNNTSLHKPLHYCTQLCKTGPNVLIAKTSLLW